MPIDINRLGGLNSLGGVASSADVDKTQYDLLSLTKQAFVSLTKPS